MNKKEIYAKKNAILLRLKFLRQDMEDKVLKDFIKLLKLSGQIDDLEKEIKELNGSDLNG